MGEGDEREEDKSTLEMQCQHQFLMTVLKYQPGLQSTVIEANNCLQRIFIYDRTFPEGDSDKRYK